MRSPALRCLVAIVCSGWLVGSPGTTSANDGEPIRCGVEMRNLSLHLAEGIVLQVRSIDGEFVSRTPNAPPVFDDPRSYTLRMKSADIWMDGASLTRLLRSSLSSPESPLRDVRITIEEGRVRASGQLRKGVSIPFSMSATVSVTPDGLLRLHADKVKAAGIPIKGLLDFVRLDVEDVLNLPRSSGMRADGDDLLMDTAAILPPPKSEGRLRDVEIAGARLHMRMVGPGSPPARPKTLPVPSARNYLYFFGGSIRFGKLTMTDADMQLVDADPSTPFDFFPLHYEQQLIAGYSRNTPRKGLQVFMPDYARVRASSGTLKPPRLR